LAALFDFLAADFFADFLAVFLAAFSAATFFGGVLVGARLTRVYVPKTLSVLMT